MIREIAESGNPYSAGTGEEEQVMVKFREHRGGFEESMQTVVELNDHAELIAYCHFLLDPFQVKFQDEDVIVAPYAYDDRIGWDSHIVTIKGYGVMGFTDGPL